MSFILQRIEWNSGTIALVVANMAPLFWALFFDWSLSGIIFLYWAENGVIGIFNIFKMIRSTAVSAPQNKFELRLWGRPYSSKSKGPLFFFFVFHYGLFTFVHGAVAFALFGKPDLGIFGFFVALGSLFMSHGISYRNNFIGKKEYERISASDLLAQPYSRIIILQLAVLVGGFLAMFFGSPIVAAVLLICLKTVVDLIEHIREHQRLNPVVQMNTQAEV
jgi:hypothetical protein